MDSITLTYQHPAVIDGETSEVRAKALAQLVDIGPRIQTLVEATVKQVRNARLDEFLAEHSGDLDEASRELSLWENGDEAAALDRLHRLGGLLVTASRAIDATG